MQKNKLISTILIFSIVFTMIFIGDAHKAKAWPVSTAIANLFPEGFDDVANFGSLADEIEQQVMDNIDGIIVAGEKIAALVAVQMITKAIIGDGGGGGTISNYSTYLYTNPQQAAMTQMNSFFVTVSQGRLSSLNYEGVGPNYDAYLVGQAKQSIATQPFQTNLQNQVSDPSQMFSAGNMKGIMTYMQCANNVACYTLTSTAQYNVEFAKAQDVAKSQQSNGFLPKKTNGQIVQPASVVATAFSSLDQMGTSLIMNADSSDGVGSASLEIAEGAALNIASRSLNYATASTAGKAAVAAGNNKFPFSAAYSTAKSTYNDTVNN